MAGATVPTEIQRFADMVLRKQARRPWAKGPGQGGCEGEQKGLGDPQISHIPFLSEEQTRNSTPDWQRLKC